MRVNKGMRMKNKTMDFDFKIKSISETGTFEGYGSVFGVKDSYDEIVVKGAFSDSINAHKAKGTMPALLWQHNSAEPVGIYTEMSEDNHGLKLTGQLAMKTSRGAEAYELLKMGAISGLSIGFVPRADSYDKVTGIRTLTKVDLWETSLVTFPANDSARVQNVKSIEELPDLKSVEQCLRDAGFSRRESATLISRIKELKQGDPETDLSEIMTALKSREAIFS
jgi:hypothetical protein